jgi:hypothetical protein
MYSQVRFELSTYALAPGLECVVPWRIPEFYSRSVTEPISSASATDALTLTPNTTHTRTYIHIYITHILDLLWAVRACFFFLVKSPCLRCFCRSLCMNWVSSSNLNFNRIVQIQGAPGLTAVREGSRNPDRHGPGRPSPVQVLNQKHPTWQEPNCILAGTHA